MKKKIIILVCLILNFSLQSASEPTPEEFEFLYQSLRLTGFLNQGEPSQQNTSELANFSEDLIIDPDITALIDADITALIDADVTDLINEINKSTPPTTSVPQDLPPAKEYSPKVMGEKKATKSKKGKRPQYCLCPFTECKFHCVKANNVNLYQHLTEKHNLNTEYSGYFKHGISVCHACKYAASNFRTFESHKKKYHNESKSKKRN